MPAMSARNAGEHVRNFLKGEGVTFDRLVSDPGMMQEYMDSLKEDNAGKRFRRSTYSEEKIRAELEACLERFSLRVFI